MAFQFASSQPVTEEPFRPTVFIGREIAVDRDELPSLRFDAEPEPDFSDSQPDNDADTVRAFNQEVLADAEGALAEVSSDEESEIGAAVTDDAVDLLKQRNAALDDGKFSESGDSDMDDAEPLEPLPEPDDGAVADVEDEGGPALPLSPVKSPVKRPAASSKGRPPKRIAKAATKATAAKPAAKPVTKAAPRAARKPKKELPAEKPTRISNRISKPRARASANRTVQPKPASPKRKASRRRVASKVANDRKTSGQEWEIESIVDSMIDADTHQHFYQVKWKGFASKDNSWEPKVNLANAQATIRAFESSNGKHGKRKSS